ncbi:phosphate transport system substrate-binding protein [Flexibacter flexilis DSM 6793]|uniref:Phosphate transport system substrate-binding protein n=1 Tax=Flexibacter flexilis DSM 6793 TaxID=927664 RepID=A0A1I1J6Z2_9BACT|nr:substrate-binding domain-containing protein [Flexibacter flexilis]SFC44314.1 phosphate transport system substrate-binding protein [Flexibacter flexilis DSM 6793]
MRYLWLFFLWWFCACSQNHRTIKIKGSDTEVNLAVLLAEKYHLHDPDLLISVSGGGSGLGIASLLNGTADIANSSRDINPSELHLFSQKKMAVSSFVFAQDAIAFVVSDKLTLDSISTQNLGLLLSGEVDNWEIFSRQKISVNIYGRQSNSGTYEYVKHRLGIRFSAYAKQMNGNAQILEAVKADSSGLGYVGAGYVMNQAHKGLKILKIYTEKAPIAVSPLDEKRIMAGQYFFQRPLFQFYKTSDKQKVKPFLDYEQTSEGLALIRASGYYPVR